LLLLHRNVVRQSNINDPIPLRITESPKYAPYFSDCLGALDGTHINTFIRGEPIAPYSNRKGRLSQNVLVACKFDLQFSYVLAGWEGSAHDGRILHNAISRGGFIIPARKYFLGDAGYSNTPYLLTLYRGVRYHLQEQLLVSQQ
jgi:hypothetical protein